MAKKVVTQKNKVQKRGYISQNEFPLFSLEKTLKIPLGIQENFAGKGASPEDIAMALGQSPTSST